jgi:hypothetical protein
MSTGTRHPQRKKKKKGKGKRGCNGARRSGRRREKLRG